MFWDVQGLFLYQCFTRTSVFYPDSLDTGLTTFTLSFTTIHLPIVMNVLIIHIICVEPVHEKDRNKLLAKREQSCQT